MQVHYDKQGTGLSGYNRDDVSLAGMVDELEAVIGHLQLSRVGLLCNSVAAMVGVAYAARHPHGVSRLIFVNPVLNGANVNMPRLIAAMRALAELAPHERDVAIETFSQLFALDDTAEPLLPVGIALRDEARPSMALALWEAYAGSDVSSLLHQIGAPTLVLHSRNNRVAHLATGVQLAARIPGAQLIPIDSSAHTMFGDDDDGSVRHCILDFLGKDISTSISSFRPPVPTLSLTRRQLNVLELIAAGKSSRAIAADLVLSERTVQRHIENVYAKFGIHNRAEATALALHLTQA
jgi:pimeloyl-ACP methyl ester carboxylesterase/DNA-binding CsgD family transcriptional regulator